MSWCVKFIVFSTVKLLIIFTFFDGVLLGAPPEFPECNDCDIEQFIPEFAEKIKSTDLCVEYDDHEIICGESLTLPMTINVPKITYDLTKKCNYATIVGITPDNVGQSPFVTYLVHNVPVKNLKDGFRGQSEDIPLEVLLGINTVGDYGARYVSSKVLTSGLLGDVRYLFLVYCQCHKIPKSKIRVFSRFGKRVHFDLKGYAKKMQLRNPKAAIYYKFDAAGISLPKVADKPV